MLFSFLNLSAPGYLGVEKNRNPGYHAYRRQTRRYCSDENDILNMATAIGLSKAVIRNIKEILPCTEKVSAGSADPV